MALKEFFYQPRCRGEFVNVTQHHDLTISKALAAKYGLSNYEAIKLAYDDADRLMVLRFLPEKLPGSVPIKQRDALVIPAKSFVRHFGIPTGQYEAHWDDKDKSLTCIHINPAQEAA